MPSELDVLSKLDPLVWRGIALPYVSRRVGFQHVNAEHKFNFAGEAIEPTGPKAWTFEYTIPLRQSLSSTARYGNLFGSIMPRLIAAMRNKSPGQLYDPVSGVFWRCVPATLSDETDPLKRDGTDITIAFVHAPETADVAAENEFTTRNDLESAAGSLDTEVEKVDWKQQEPPPQTVNPLQAIGGIADQLETGVNKNLNALEKVIAQTEDMEEQIEDLEEPKNFSLKRRARRTRALAFRVRQRHGNPTQRIVTVTTRYTQTISEVASNLGMSVVDFLAINTDLVGYTEIPPETPVNRYQNG